MLGSNHDADVLGLFAARDDPENRRLLVEEFDPLARGLARRFRGRGVASEDLLQVARLGLLNAIDRFDVERGVKFTTYAGRTIIGELKHYFRDHVWPLRVPRVLQNLWLESAAAVDELTQRLARAPTIAEIARHIDATEEDVLEALDAARAYVPKSLDQPVADDTTSIGDLVGNVDPSLVSYAEYSTLVDQLRSLPQRQQTIIYLRFFEGRTQSEIGKLVGVSQVQISRLFAAAVEELRRRMS